MLEDYDFSQKQMSPEELEELFGQARAELGISSPANSTPSSDTEPSWLKEQYTLFSIPGLTVYLQGPKIGLPLDDIDAEWKEPFSKQLVVVRPYNYKGALTARARKIITDAKNHVGSLYNKERGIHRKILEALLEEEVKLDMNKCLNPAVVKDTLAQYKADRNRYLKSKGFDTYSEWEAKAKSEAGITFLSSADIAAAWDTL